MIATSTLSINAFTGVGSPAGPIADGERWALRNKPPDVRPFLKPPAEADERDWRSDEVGWGVVLAPNPERTPAQLATAEDAPEPIVDLVRSRGDAPVFRYDPAHPGFLYDYRNDALLSMASSPSGVGKGKLPRYLLIYGSPNEVPWRAQFALNASRIVGRLHLTGPALENYVAALKNEWSAAASRPARTLVWSTDYGPDDITALMREVVAAPLQRAFEGDDDIETARALIGADATGANLASSLARDNPAVVVTTSHGKTYPLEDPVAMGETIGLLIDQSKDAVEVDAVTADWAPDGAIWYAHACCSAGCDSATAFRGLVAEGSELERVLSGIPAAGARVAPLPTALLSHAKPARAFIGHVEPTFDWTLRDRQSSGSYEKPFVEAMYSNVFRKAPVGYGFRALYARLGGVYAQYDEALLRYNTGADNADELLGHLLVARDIRSTILLGDPTVGIS